MMIEPFSIVNPQRGLFKFLFRDEYNESNVSAAGKFITQWAADKGWSIVTDKPHRQARYRDIRRQGLFEVKVWLK